ncbi:MAG TPA: AbrB/MazE/SpoVT family DNA-binding domain-containing protein [Candidatus Saccharimonadales bacterium]|nr:AbrB/MazE/SpoVT family DNA-binding domain-containing protein [Candidatus Saccharimonadales bacterium]
MHDKKIYGTATVGTKGQIVIPSDVRKEFNIEAGDRVYLMGSQEGKWIGIIQEDRMREVLAHLTDHIEVFKDMLNNPPKENKE